MNENILSKKEILSFLNMNFNIGELRSKNNNNNFRQRLSKFDSIIKEEDCINSIIYNLIDPLSIFISNDEILNKYEKELKYFLNNYPKFFSGFDINIQKSIILILVSLRGLNLCCNSFEFIDFLPFDENQNNLNLLKEFLDTGKINENTFYNIKKCNGSNISRKNLLENLKEDKILFSKFFFQIPIWNLWEQLKHYNEDLYSFLIDLIKKILTTFNNSSLDNKNNILDIIFSFLPDSPDKENIKNQLNKLTKKFMTIDTNIMKQIFEIIYCLKFDEILDMEKLNNNLIHAKLIKSISQYNNLKKNYTYNKHIELFDNLYYLKNNNNQYEIMFYYYFIMDSQSLIKKNILTSRNKQLLKRFLNKLENIKLLENTEFFSGKSKSYCEFLNIFHITENMINMKASIDLFTDFGKEKYKEQINNLNLKFIELMKN